jgi:hypothetical protein
MFGGSVAVLVIFVALVLRTTEAFEAKLSSLKLNQTEAEPDCS